MTGQYAHTVDAKGRLFIPAKLRDELGDAFYVTIGMDGCLSVYSEGSWANFMDKLSALPYSKTKALRALPAKLRQYADLDKDVVVIGSFDRAEIWNAQRWAEMENEALSSGDLEAAMEEMGL